MTDKKKILLVEDDQYIVRAYKDGLMRAGFEVLIASDGNEALEKIKKDLPDLILLDLIMPVKNGFEVLEELKMNGETKKIPVAILSNLGQDSDIKKGKALGAIDYLIKSNFSMKEVVEKVKFYIAVKL
ncbi:response regulator [Patescibacteria group bacterium]|nr:response regulator [Patescibacteria group bacterium]MBU1663618.1 response regulator [Patescibacteria group bacterium]MBU1934319.1 response regulator [Patescibacteria group bacterium]MBU2233991.1 response regulator [Patescibacteria group bacterium]MBU2264410.1 response regulator [Patescibacteria group bacterium]